MTADLIVTDDEGKAGKVKTVARDKFLDLREDPYSTDNFNYEAVRDGARRIVSPDVTPTGEEIEQKLKDQGLALFYDAGHRFRVDKIPAPSDWKISAVHARYCWWCGQRNPQRIEFECECAGPPMTGCQCSGCISNEMARRHEIRGRGRVAECCSPEHAKLRRRAIDGWKRKAKRCEERGLEPPPEPQRAQMQLDAEDIRLIERMLFDWEMSVWKDVGKGVWYRESPEAAEIRQQTNPLGPSGLPLKREVRQRPRRDYVPPGYRGMPYERYPHGPCV